MIAVKVAGTAQGRKYGYSFKNLLLPNKLGNRSAGLESAPPMIGLFREVKSESNRILSRKLRSSGRLTQ